MREIRKDLKNALEKGKIIIGANEAIRAASAGKVKVIVYSANCPPDTRERLKTAAKNGKVDVEQFDGNSIELGTFCGKSFPVSVLAF